MRSSFLLGFQPASLLRSLRAGACLLAGLAVFATSAYAQQQPRAISFNEAVRIALEQNIALQQAENQSELRSINVSRARMNFLPDLSLSTGASQSYGRSFNEVQGEIINVQSRGVNVGAGSSVNLFNGFGDVATLREARLYEEAGEFDLERARQRVVFDVMSGFLTLVERRELIRVREENLASQQSQLERIQEFTRVGSRPISDLYLQQAAVASAELEVLRAQQLFQIAESNLIQTLQLDPFQPYEFTIPPVDDVALAPETYNMGTLLRNAIENRPDFRAGELAAQGARQGINASRAGIWPSIGMNFRYGSDWLNVNPTSFSEQLDANRGGGFGFSVSIPLFDRFTTRNNVQQARVQYDNARLDLESLEQEIAVQVRQAHLDYLTAQKSVTVAETQMQSAELALEAAQERYNVGAATLVEVSQAQASFVEAESALVQAKYDVIFREKLIDYYLGVLNPQEPLF